MLELLLVWLGITGMVEGVNYSVYFKLINSIYSSGYKINYNNLPSWIKNYQIDCINGKIQVEFEPEMQTESNVNYYQYFNFYKYTKN